MRSNYNYNSGGTLGVSDVLAIKPGQVIPEDNPGRFKKVIIRQDPVTLLSGTMVSIVNGITTSYVSDDLVVTGVDAITGTDRSYNSITIFNDATLTVN